MFGLNNTVDQSFKADGISNDGKIVLEVEAGRAYANFAFLKDVFQASMMYGVEFLILAQDWVCKVFVDTLMCKEMRCCEVQEKMVSFPNNHFHRRGYRWINKYIIR
ncbi:MAG: hypothetical protein OXU23_07730 [Candidatus Poribacteria bacterium]|nr:hypothetical protein [Candidatus Poribacteria bacterium]